MNITASIDLVGAYKRREAAKATAVASYALPTMVYGAMMTISDLIKNKDGVRTQKAMRSLTETMLQAMVQVIKGKDVHFTIENKEKELLRTLGKSVLDGALWIVRRTAQALFWVAEVALRYLAVPLIRIIGAVLVEAVSLIFSPAGLVIGGIALGYLAYQVYKKMNGGSAPEELNPDKQLKTTGETTSTQNIQATPIAKPTTHADTLSGVKPGAPIAYRTSVSTPTQPSTSTQAVDMTLPMGIRQNNPGNLRNVGQTGATGERNAIATFPTAQDGLVQLARQISLYYNRDKLETVRAIITKYAPSNENNTEAYISHVCKLMGVKADDKLNLSDVATMTKLVNAIIWHENGMNPYTVTQITAAATTVINPASVALASDTFYAPASGRITSPFGKRAAPKKGASTYHKGIDIAGPTGTPIGAATHGTVTALNTAGEYGKAIIVKGSKWYTLYAHLSSIEVAQGQEVGRGQLIGKMGNTGVSTGPHLHFEAHPVLANGTMGEAVDPAPLLGVVDTTEVHIGAVVLPNTQKDLARVQSGQIVRVG